MLDFLREFDHMGPYQQVVAFIAVGEYDLISLCRIVRAHKIMAVQAGSYVEEAIHQTIIQYFFSIYRELMGESKDAALARVRTSVLVELTRRKWYEEIAKTIAMAG